MASVAPTLTHACLPCTWQEGRATLAIALADAFSKGFFMLARLLLSAYDTNHEGDQYLLKKEDAWKTFDL
jgi:hypothetical protein